VKLKNRGNDPYKGDIYGDSICIEHRISSDGCRTCKIKSKMGNRMTSVDRFYQKQPRASSLFTHILRFALFLGHVISTKKEELTAILDHFGIQVPLQTQLAYSANL